jgi:phospholipase C
MRSMRRVLAGLSATLALAAPAWAQEAPKAVPGLDRIGHIIVIYLENRSFDQLYGLFPGAEGIANAGAAAIQVDRDGKPYDKLPPVLNTNFKPPQIDSRFPTDLPNKPYRAEPYVTLSQVTGDAWHRYYQEQLQIDGGKMDKFVAWSDAGSLVMSYFDGSPAPLWAYARDYALLDHFHHAAFGGSFMNHMLFVCGCVARFEGAPADMVAKLDDQGALARDGAVTPDGYAVNTILPRSGPLPPNYDLSKTLPLQTNPTIGDRLDEKGVDWAWYSGGWDAAVAGKPGPLFQFHHQPFAYFAHYALGTPGAKAHLKDEVDFVDGIESGQLPPVVFFKPSGEDNEHPGYASVLAGEYHTALLLRLIERSPLWKDSVVIVTYDENGGLWDHVAPPVVDRWGPGTRVPTLVISPFARRGFIDHTVYDTTAILKLIETRFALAPLGARDAASADMTPALDLR